MGRQDANADQALLPAGLEDVLPPTAGHESRLTENLIEGFRQRGYERVKPPLIEFEESLLAGPGGQVASQTFRLMDPFSQRMMGLRADITPQIARIATTRLQGQARPLRLCYAGQVLRVKGTQLRPERQFGQVGAELIGVAGPAADAEIILMAAETLIAAGITSLSIDLCLPSMIAEICQELALDEGDAAALIEALDRKDAAEVQSLAGPHSALFEGLLRASGPLDQALEKISKLSLPKVASDLVEELVHSVDLIRRAAPQLALTLDPVERRGFEYQTGLSFTLFAPGVRGELGRGGRYRLVSSKGLGGETALGFTLYMDSLLRALPAGEDRKPVLLPVSTAPEIARRLRQEGWVTIGALEVHEDLKAEAKRLGCGYLLVGESPQALEE